MKIKIWGDLMKKIFPILLLLISFFITGCGKYDESDVVRDLNKQINKLNSYKLEGTLEIVNNEDVYNYSVDTSFKKDNYYKVNLTNKSNNYEQIILKNDDGVYVKTQESTKQKLNVI